MRVISISDLHIGQGEDLEKLIRACNWVHARKPDALVLNGDIGELLWFPVGALLKGKVLDSWEVLRRLVVSVPEVFWVYGNHDLRDLGAEKLAAEVFPSKVKMVEWVILNGIYYFHGHQIDRTTRMWNWLASVPGVARLLPWLYRRLYGSPYAKLLRAMGLAPAGARRSFEEYNLYVDHLFHKAKELAKEKNMPVVFGHIHQAVISRGYEYRDIWTVNSGSWGHPNWSAVEVIDGHPKLHLNVLSG